jgi:anti-sigma B factor antagonist
MADGHPQRINVTEKDGAVVVQFRDSKILDDRTIQQMGNELFELVQGNPGLRLVLDFTGVRYLSSAALGKLITLRRKVDQATGSLRLCELAPETLDVFKIAKLDEYFQICPTQRAALEPVE